MTPIPAPQPPEQSPRRRSTQARRTKAVAGAIGISSRQIAKPVLSAFGTIAVMSPSMPQYIGRI